MSPSHVASRPLAAGLGALVLATAACSGAPGPGAGGSPAPPASPSATASAGPPTSPAAGSNDWPTYHGDASRSGSSPTAPRPARLLAAWDKTLDAKVYAAPVVIGTTAVVATENNTVYAFDVRTGAQRWKRHLAAPVPRADLPCGNIDPLGITGTPAYDPATRRVFVVTEQPGVVHRLYGLDLATGAVAVSRTADPPRQDPRPMQQRGALLIAGGRVYVAYGGLAGDCGGYHGHVVSLPTDGAGPMQLWRVPTPREGGIWTPPGPTLSFDGRSIFVSVGNGESTTTYDGSDSVVRLSLDLRRLDWFAPTTWRADNRADLDLGSMAPALLPNNRILIAGKRGTGYLLDGSDLGHIGGQLAAQDLCVAFGGAARISQTVYVPCTDGLRAVAVGDRTFSVRWRAPANVTGSPVVAANSAVYALDPSGGTLFVLDARSGDVITSHAVGAATRFATPALWRDRVLVGTERGIVVLRAVP